MANPFRNEEDVELGGKQYRLRATFDAIAEIEDTFDMSLYEIIYTKLGAGKARAKDVVFILGALIRGAGDKVSQEELSEAVAAEGIQIALNKTGKVLAQAFSGPVDEKKPM